MRNFLIFGFLIFIFIACNHELEKPKDLIPRKEMISILKDIYIFKQVKNYQLDKNLPDAPEGNLAILRNHNVTLEQFQTSYKYYIIDNASFDKMLEEVKQEMKAQLPPEELNNEKGGKVLPPSAQ